MKKLTILFTIVIVTFLIGCHDNIDPEVNTLYLEDGDYEARKAEAVTKLYHYYIDNRRDKEYFEVISKRNFVLNYYPDGGVLTLGTDSGWIKQYKNVDESRLESLVAQKFTFDELDVNGAAGSKYDSLLVENSPRVEVKSNMSYDL